jgi:hypothetical protein
MFIRQNNGRWRRATLAGGGESLVEASLLVFGLPSLILGLTMAIAPAVFFELVGPYGVRNDHYIHDTASFQIALAVLLLVALRVPAWRVPALVANAIQWSIHAISHAIDVGDAQPTWLGYFDLAALTAGSALLILLAILAARRDGERAGP